MRSQFDDNGQRPDVNDVVAQVSQTVWRNMRRLRPILGLILLVGLGIASFYQVEPGELGVVRTFGRESSRTGPGPHFRVPLAQQVDIVNIQEIRRLEVGFRGDQKVAHEAMMITGDENIVEAEMIVQYRVSDPSKYLFRISDPEGTLLATAEVALRSMVGRTNIDDVFTTGRETVQEETRTWLQKLMNDYQSGLTITEVKLQVVDAPDAVRDAFHDVVRAREEKEKLINQARGYAADAIPKARGEARVRVREAEGYREQRVLRAKGDSQKFASILEEYRKAELVTRKRLYLETMERILAKVERKVLVDEKLGNNTLPLLPLGVGAAAPALGGQQ